MKEVKILSGAQLFQMKITLIGIEPQIWRRLLVPGNIRLDILHQTFQAVMGWEDEHLHQFLINGTSYGDPDKPPSEEFTSERGLKSELKFLNLKVGNKFRYIYDFGDDWIHEVLIEEVSNLTKADSYPKCTGGERACPPEDCGGVPGYLQLLQVLKNPKDEDFEYIQEMFDGFDPEAFSSKLKLPKMLTFS